MICSSPYPGLGNPGLEYAIPLGLTSIDFFEERSCGKNGKQPATCNLQPATCNLQPATCNLQPATQATRLLESQRIQIGVAHYDAETYRCPS